jgi:hypothetical protein
MGVDTDLEHISYEQVGGSVFDSPRGVGGERLFCRGRERGCFVFCATGGSVVL